MKKVSLLKFLLNLQNYCVYGKGRKSDIPDENLPSLTNKMFKNAMISAAILCYDVTKTFFINNIAFKVNIENFSDICARSYSLLQKSGQTWWLDICSSWSAILSVLLGTKFSSNKMEKLFHPCRKPDPILI